MEAAAAAKALAVDPLVPALLSATAFMVNIVLALELFSLQLLL